MTPALHMADALDTCLPQSVQAQQITRQKQQFQESEHVHSQLQMGLHGSVAILPLR